MADYARVDMLAGPQWLANHLNAPDVRVVDARGANRYGSEHIPHAVNLPVARIDDPASPVRSALLPPDRFGVLVGNTGIANGDTVVIYDDGVGLMAARLFWALHYYRHEKLAILEGGIPRWMAKGKEVTNAAASVQPKSYTAQPHLDRGATKEVVVERLGKGDTVLLDVRSWDEYTGAVVQALRGGHIPGAKFLEWTSALVEGSVPVLKSAEELAQQFVALGVTPDKEIITYCQGGVRAAHTYYVLRLLGYDKVRNYTGSWGEWGNDPSLPIEQGE